MDPQQTWTDMLEALERKQWQPAKELADSLYEWLKKGGFPPTTIGAKSIGKNWHAAAAQFVCLTIASKANDLEKRRSRKSQEASQ